MASSKAFETKTVESKKSVVDDKLKPTAEMHILVGGPYTSLDGEEHRYGHTALRVKSAKSDVTYDFGRYRAISGLFGESGEGILRVWSLFQPYISSEIALRRETTAFVYPIFEHQADAINAHFAEMTRTAQEISSKKRSTLSVYKLTTDYHALGPNCTTLSIDGAKVAFPKFDSGADKFNRPEDVLNFKERLALNAKGGAPRLFLPANLQVYLSSSAAMKPVKIERYGARK